ncbi:hypothetical protein H1R20_g6082, partial [Candolleomyces eurysporus]
MLWTGKTRSVDDIPPSGIPPILFSSTLRLFCLRCILVAGTVAMTFQIYRRAVPEAVILGATVLHHLLSAFGPRFIPLYTWLDLLLMLAELGFGIFVAVVSFSPRMKKYQWLSQHLVAGDFIFWLLTIMLAALLCVKVVQLIDARGKLLSQRLDILRDRVSDSPGYSRLRSIGDGKSISWWRYPIHVLFGRKIWEQQLPGEASWMTLIRGLLALLFISSLSIFGLFQIVLDPVSEMGLTPNRVFRTERLDQNYRTTTPIVWNLIVIWEKHPGAPQTLRESISLTPLWTIRKRKNSSQGPFGPECSAITVTQDILPPAVNASRFDVVIFYCRPRILIPPDKAHDLLPYFTHPFDTRPNLFLEANFTGLMSPGQLPNTHSDVTSDAMRVYLAMTNNTEDVLLTTRPAYLFPGSNAIGVADLIYKKDIANDYFSLHEGTKPLTPFGIFHQLGSQRAQVSVSTVEKYRGLRSDLQSLKDNPGLLALILDTLIDLDVVAEEHPHGMKSKRRLNAKLRDVEQELSAEKQDSALDPNQEDSAAAPQRLIRSNSNGSDAKRASRDSDSSDEGEELDVSIEGETNEPLLEEQRRRLNLVGTSSRVYQEAQQ